VMWLVGELGLAHRHVELGGRFGGLDAAEFTAMNPHARVPVIQDGETVVWESHTILRYLAARHEGAGFWSPGPAERSLADCWMDWAQTALQPAFLTGVFWGFYRTPAPQRDLPAIARQVARCAEYFGLVDQFLGTRLHMLGDRLSLADIPIGTHLYRYYNLDIERPRLANVEAWYRRLQERPAYRQHVMVPFEELHGRLAY
jgi:glutathione S-transferase